MLGKKLVFIVCAFLFPQRMFLVLELCKGGELLALLKIKGHFTEEVRLVYCTCVCVYDVLSHVRMCDCVCIL